jgi:anti-sigma factor RsiW
MHHCPDEELLAAWFDGLLAPEARDALAADLASCPDCVRLLATLGLVIEAEDPALLARTVVPAAVTRRALDLWPEPELKTDPILRSLRVAVRWVHDRLAPLADALAPQPTAAMAMRGAQATDLQEELHYQVRVGELDLTLDLEVDGPEQVALSVRPMSTPPAGLVMRLTEDGETRAMSSLTASGATVPALPMGAYELCLEQGGRRLGHLELSLR